MDRDIPFLDKNNERKLLIMRVYRIIEDLQHRIYSASVDTGDFLYREGQVGTEDENKNEWTTFGRNDFWGSRELYCQFKQSFTVPEEFAGKTLVYDITCYPDTEWRGPAQQFILFLDGKQVQGIDSNHTFIYLPDTSAGRSYDVFLNAYYDDDEFRGKAQLRASLRVFDKAVNDVYYDLKVLWDTAHLFDVDNSNRVDIVKAMNEACNIIELETDDYDEFIDSCKKASEYLHKNVYGVKNDIVMSAIGHTHIDVAWRWRLRQTREKAGRSFATVLNLMKEFPEYRFMSPQAQLYDYVKKDYPELYKGIKQAIKDGKWEAEGSMWVESDTNIISGESLVRQFIYGKGFFKDEFGVDNKIMWLPDVFGYSGALPQIMAKCDIDYFMTTKIGWCEYNRFPYDTFMWKGIDGTGILSHFIPARNRDDKDDFNSTYNASINPAIAHYSWKRYSQKDLNKNILCSFGHGDGGGGPERSYLENAKRLNEGVPGVPNVKQEFAIDFFKNLDKEVRDNKYLPSWKGELYLEYHRGVLTAQARNKKYNRKSEILMHDAETLCSLAHTLKGKDYPHEKFDELWKLILLNQFHDIIPGSSIENVYKDSKEQYEYVLAEGKKLVDDATKALTVNSDSDKITVFNTLGFTRGGVVKLDCDRDVTIYDGDKALPTQRAYDGKLIFLAPEIPSKGWKTFRIGEVADLEKAVKCDGTASVETDVYSVKFDDEMSIASLYHKPTGRFVAPEGETLGKITAYQDRSHMYEAWDIKCYYDEKSYPLVFDSAELVEDGSVRSVIKVNAHFKTSPVTRYYIFTKDGRIDIDYDIDWHEKNIALKADYPVDVNADRATFDIQFGNLERTTTNNTLRDYAQFEVCGHKWVDLSDSSFGLAVLNDCKYGFTVKDGHIMPTLLRSATKPNVNQDRERHTFTYSLSAHEGEVRGSDVNVEGYKLNVPFIAVTGDCGDYGFVSCDKSNIVIETVKLAEKEDAVIVRMYESANKRTVCNLKFDEAKKSISECNMLEIKDELLAEGTDSVELTFRPFEIKTIKIK